MTHSIRDLLSAAQADAWARFSVGDPGRLPELLPDAHMSETRKLSGAWSALFTIDTVEKAWAKAESIRGSPVNGYVNEMLCWAVSRWKAEVENRPLVNVHRRALDDTWRQVIRHLGGDPDDLLGMVSHDELCILRDRLAPLQAEASQAREGNACPACDGYGGQYQPGGLLCKACKGTGKVVEKASDAE